jgi:hypothetical protein
MARLAPLRYSYSGGVIRWQQSPELTGLAASWNFLVLSLRRPRDGELIPAAEEERFSHKKRDYEFPQHASDFCLRAGGIEAPGLCSKKQLKE